MGDNYVDLFATKGLEYILVIAFLVTLVVFWKFLNRPTRAVLAPGAGLERRSAPNGWFHLPNELYYHQGHSWAMPEHDDVVKVGIDDFAQRLLGRAHSVKLPPVGAPIGQGEKGWELIVDSKSISMLSPINGEVVELNEKVIESPDLINQDPYEEGWLMKVRASKLKTDIKNLLSGTLARRWNEETVDALRGRVAGDLGVVLQDGGIPVVGVAKSISPDKWDEIVAEFFLTK